MTRFRQHCMKLLAALLALAPLTAAPAFADADEDLLELKVKAAFLFNFAKFVTWPAGAFAGPYSPILICVLEPDPFGQILDDTVRGKTVNDRELVVRRSARPADLKACHIVYTGERDPSHIGTDFAAFQGHPALTVHEGSEALPDGAVRFVLDNRRVRFEINTAATDREGLQLSSKLLSLSAVVRR